MEPGAETDRAAEVERQREVIEQQGRRIAELEAMAAEREQIRRRLADAEQELATLPELRRAAQELETVRSSAAWRFAAAARVPGLRVREVWIPALRKRAKQVLGRLMSFLRSP
jgi:anti-sigma factor RsiW